MAKENVKKQKVRKLIKMEVVNPYSAGIDIGDKEHVVAVPEGPPRCSGCSAGYPELWIKALLQRALIRRGGTEKLKSRME